MAFSHTRSKWLQVVHKTPPSPLRISAQNKAGFSVWTEEDIKKYDQKWHHGTHEYLD